MEEDQAFLEDFTALIEGRAVAHTHAPRGWLLLSFDTTHDLEKLKTMYGSAANSEFICNLMHRAANEFPQLGLDPNGFRYEYDYGEESGQFAGLLTATRTQNCKLWRIKKGRKFHVVNSYKISPQRFKKAVDDIGYSVAHHVLDEASGAALYLLRSNAIPNE